TAGQTDEVHDGNRTGSHFTPGAGRGERTRTLSALGAGGGESDVAEKRPKAAKSGQNGRSAGKIHHRGTKDTKGGEEEGSRRGGGRDVGSRSGMGSCDGKANQRTERRRRGDRAAKRRQEAARAGSAGERVGDNGVRGRRLSAEGTGDGRREPWSVAKR